MDDEIIKLKGTGDGIKIYLASGFSITEITHALYTKLDEYRKFFGSGKCSIYFIGENISDTDKLRLEAVSKAMLPEAAVNYGEKTILKKLESLLEKSAEKQKTAKKDDEAPRQAPEDLEEVIATNFKSSRARFFEGAVKPGRRVESDSHMVLVGDVLEGGEVCASGNIVIFGRLLGSAHAGTGGSKNAYIIALDFMPQGVAIAGTGVTEVDFKGGGAKKAYLINNEIFIEEFLLNI